MSTMIYGYQETPFDGSRASGECTNAAVGFFSVSGQARQNHIIDADGNLADITTKFNTLLADIEGYGLLKTS